MDLFEDLIQHDYHISAGQFFGFHGSRTSQFPPDDNGVWETSEVLNILLQIFFSFLSNINFYCY